MRIGLNGGGHTTDLGAIRAQAARAAADGFASYWLSQITGPDVLTTLAVVGAETTGLELGTAVVPVYSRHPLALASQALTVQAASGGRLVLGIGPSHRMMVEAMLGASYARPYTYVREYLAVLKPLLRGDPVDFAGACITARGRVTVEAPPCPILLAALAPRMLALAGSEADGAVTWMVGPRTLRNHVAPALWKAAEAARRPPPRIVVGLPVCVTDDVARAKRHAVETLAIYGTLPAYRATLDREGVDGPADLLIAGDETAVRERVAALADAGATDLRAAELCPHDDDRARTRALLRSLLAR
jgi:F420-dependent oxidoreductase-like protein